MAPPADSDCRGFDRGPADSDSARHAVGLALADLRPLVTMLREGLVLVALESAAPARTRDYLAFPEAVERGQVEVREVGSVGVIEVEGVTRDANVVLLGGETIVGPGQNLVVNVTTWLAAGSRTAIPVTPLEGGRPNARGELEGGPANAGGRLEVGRLVDYGMRSILSFSSPAAALHDLDRPGEAELETFRRAFPYPPGSTALALGLGNQIVALDVFDSAETLERQWPRLVESGVSALADYRRALRSGLVRPPRQSRPAPEVVARLIDRGRRGLSTAAVTPSAGEGVDVRFSGGGVRGSALVHGARAVQVAVFREAL